MAGRMMWCRLGGALALLGAGVVMLLAPYHPVCVCVCVCPLPMRQWGLSHGAGRAASPQPLIPTPLGRAHLPSQAAGIRGLWSPHCSRGAMLAGGNPALCMSVAVAFVRGLSVGVCPSVCVSISQEIKLCTPSSAARGGGEGGPPPSISCLFLWFGTKRSRPPPARPCVPQSLPILTAQWCHWRGSGCPLPWRWLGSRGSHPVRSPVSRWAAAAVPGWVPRPWAGCRVRTAHGARGSS